MIGIVLWSLRWPLVTVAWASIAIVLVMLWRRQTRMFLDVQRTAAMAEPVLGKILATMTHDMRRKPLDDYLEGLDVDLDDC